MPSQFFGLQIGYSGLTAYQAALNTTGNNIANVETKGYSRQVINQTASQALRTYSTYGMAGSGTTVNSIDQVRNSYYDTKYRNATSSLGEYDIKSEYNAQIENYFNDDGETIQGFATIFDSFFTAMEEVEKNPGDVSTRTQFVGKANALCEYFNANAINLTNLQVDTNTRIKTVVEEISNLAEKIATINHEINIIELKGMAANELRDERNNLVDELSKYVDVEIIEAPIYTSDDVDEDGKPLGEKTGAYKYTVIVAGNNTLVEGYEYRTLGVKARENWNKVNQSDADGLYDIYWEDTGIDYYPVNSQFSGELKGLLQIRDGNNSEYFHGVVSDYDEDARTLTITTSASDEALQDLNKCTLNPTGILDVGNGVYRYDSWEVDEAADGTLTYTFYMASDDLQTTDYTGSKRSFASLVASIESYRSRSVDPVAEVGGNVDYQGIPYYQEQMNEWIRLFAQAFNSVEQTGEDLNGNPLYGSASDSSKLTNPLSFFVAKDLTGQRDEDYSFYDDYDYPDTPTDESQGTKSGTSDSYRQLTAANFSVNRSILADASRMSTTATQGNINIDAADVVKELEGLKDKKNFFRGCTSGEFLNCVLGDVALNANSANVFKSNFNNIQETIVNQRLSISGVDNDEEALNLVKYQNAYNLSAKMIQVMTEIYDRLILETGV